MGKQREIKTICGRERGWLGRARAGGMRHTARESSGRCRGGSSSRSLCREEAERQLRWEFWGDRQWLCFLLSQGAGASAGTPGRPRCPLALCSPAGPFHHRPGSQRRARSGAVASFPPGSTVSAPGNAPGPVPPRGNRGFLHGASCGSGNLPPTRARRTQGLREQPVVSLPASTEPFPLPSPFLSGKGSAFHVPKETRVRKHKQGSCLRCLTDIDGASTDERKHCRDRDLRAAVASCPSSRVTDSGKEHGRLPRAAPACAPLSAAEHRLCGRAAPGGSSRGPRAVGRHAAGSGLLLGRDNGEEEQ